jgi:hypothetical protein
MLMALDALPNEPPPGFPRAPAQGAAERYACDAPDAESAQPVQPSEDEQSP